MAEVVDNVDPNEFGRIKVKLVTTHNEAETYWAWQIAPMTGKERGFYTLPEVGDTVLVAFIQGSQDNAVILGALWNGKDIPPKECSTDMPTPDKNVVSGAKKATEQFTEGNPGIDNNDRRFWKSRSGHLFVFDDSEGKETVHIWDKSHTLSIVFDTAKKLMNITNNQGNIQISAKQDLILESVSGDVIIQSGKDIKIEAQSNITQKTVSGNWTADTTGNAKFASTGNSTVEATGTAKLASTSGSTNVEGAISTTVKGGASTSVESSGMTKVQGSIVKIN